MEDEIGQPERPLDVDGIAHLAERQGPTPNFWLRELCMQLAALREEVINISNKLDRNRPEGEL